MLLLCVFTARVCLHVWCVRVSACACLHTGLCSDPADQAGQQRDECHLCQSTAEPDLRAASIRPSGTQRVAVDAAVAFCCVPCTFDPRECTDTANVLETEGVIRVMPYPHQVRVRDAVIEACNSYKRLQVVVDAAAHPLTCGG